MPPLRNPELGDFIREARAEKSLTLRALGELADLDFSTVAKMERGEFRYLHPAKLQKLAAVLEVEVEALYDLAGYPTPLPEFAPYLRSKYGLPDDAVEELEAYFARIREQYGSAKGKPKTRTKRGKPRR